MNRQWIEGNLGKLLMCCSIPPELGAEHPRASFGRHPGDDRVTDNRLCFIG